MSEKLDIKKILFKKKKRGYGDDYTSHLIEIYKLYVKTADNISDRRQSANSFFLTVNTAIIGIISYMQLGLKSKSDTGLYWIIGIAGMALCYTWFRLIRSYKDLNSGKFKVIHEIEQNLPIAPYDAEWESLGRGENPKLYHPFTKVEMNVPWIFFSLHFIIFALSFPWKIAYKVIVFILT